MSPDPRVAFLVSAPRSGSTLLQNLLASCRCVESPPETWLLFRLAEVKRRLPQRYYRERLAVEAVANYLDVEPDEAPDSLTVEEASRIYRQQVSEGCQVLLDKTPRYYRLLDLIRERFRDSKLILPRRNPFAVLRSLFEERAHRGVRELLRPYWLGDLFVAPAAMTAHADEPGVTVIRYEDLVDRPEATLESLTAALGLDADDLDTSYSPEEVPDQGFGDQKSVHRHSGLVRGYRDLWVDGFDGCDRQGYALAYGDVLRDRLGDVVGGYDIPELQDRIHRGRFAGLARRRWRWELRAAIKRYRKIDERLNAAAL